MPPFPLNLAPATFKAGHKSILQLQPLGPHKRCNELQMACLAEGCEPAVGRQSATRETVSCLPAEPRSYQRGRGCHGGRRLYALRGLQEGQSKCYAHAHAISNRFGLGAHLPLECPGWRRLCSLH